MPAIGIARIRRGPLSATMVLGRSSRLLTFRYGEAVLEGVRFASAFFGKGQFVPDTASKQEEGKYIFPANARSAVVSSRWRRRSPPTRGPPARARRIKTEICRLEQSAEESRRFRMNCYRAAPTACPWPSRSRVAAAPQLEGVQAVAGMPDCFTL